MGRSKDLIISGGYNVYFAESAVVGVPDMDFGEVGVAVVVGKPGVRLEPQNILVALKTMLANLIVPKRCYSVAELPRNTMGKVQKTCCVRSTPIQLRESS